MLKTDLENLKNYNTIDNQTKIELLNSLRKIKLLTPDTANAKTAKNSQFANYKSYILHLSPADLAYNFINRKGTFCPKASMGCKMACLNTAGRGRFNSIQESRLRKSLYYIHMRDQFIGHLSKEIAKLEQKAIKDNKQLVIRLNGTSDLNWLDIIIQFPKVQFYDYTAILRNAIKAKSIKNYFVVFSAKEDNQKECTEALLNGINAAMVFDQIPETFEGFKVINGDQHDFRFLDHGVGVIIGLKAKGKAKKDETGFVRKVNQIDTFLKHKKVVINYV